MRKIILGRRRGRRGGGRRAEGRSAGSALLEHAREISGSTGLCRRGRGGRGCRYGRKRRRRRSGAGSRRKQLREVARRVRWRGRCGRRRRCGTGAGSKKARELAWGAGGRGWRGRWRRRGRRRRCGAGAGGKEARELARLTGRGGWRGRRGWGGCWRGGRWCGRVGAGRKKARELTRLAGRRGWRGGWWWCGWRRGRRWRRGRLDRLLSGGDLLRIEEHGELAGLDLGGGCRSGGHGCWWCWSGGRAGHPVCPCLQVGEVVDQCCDGVRRFGGVEHLEELPAGGGGFRGEQIAQPDEQRRARAFGSRTPQVQQDFTLCGDLAGQEGLGLAVEDEFDQFVALIEAHG